MFSVAGSNSHNDTNNTLQSYQENNSSTPKPPLSSSSSSLSLSHHSEIAHPVNITSPVDNSIIRSREASEKESFVSPESKPFSTPTTTTSATLSSMLLRSPRSQLSPSRMSGDFVQCVSPSPPQPEPLIHELEEKEETHDEECPLPLHTESKDINIVSEINISEKNSSNNDKSKRETDVDSVHETSCTDIDYINSQSIGWSLEGSVSKLMTNEQVKSNAISSSSPTQSCTPHTLSFSTSSLSQLSSSSSSLIPSSSLHKTKTHSSSSPHHQHHHHHRNNKQKEHSNVHNSRKSKSEYLYNAGNNNNNDNEKMRSSTKSSTIKEEQANVNTNITTSRNSYAKKKENSYKRHNKATSFVSTEHHSRNTNKYMSTVSSLLLEPFPHSRVLSVCLVHDTLLTTHHSGICLYKEKSKMKEEELNACHNKNAINAKCTEATSNYKAMQAYSSSFYSPSHLLSKKQQIQKEYYYYGYGVWELVETRNEMYCRDAYLSTPALYPSTSQLPTRNNKNIITLENVKSIHGVNTKSGLLNEQYVPENTSKFINYNWSNSFTTINNKKDSYKEKYKTNVPLVSSSSLLSSSLLHPYARYFALACGNDHSGHSICICSTAAHFVLHHNLHKEHKVVALHFTLIPLEPLLITTSMMMSPHIKVKPLVVSIDEIGQIALFDIDRNHYALVRNCPQRILNLMQQFSINNTKNYEETEKGKGKTSKNKLYCVDLKVSKEKVINHTNKEHPTMYQLQDMEGFEKELTQELLIPSASLDALPLYQLENGIAVNVTCTGPCLQLCNECRNLFCGVSGSDYYVQEEKEDVYMNGCRSNNNESYKYKKHKNTHNSFMAVNLFISCRGRDVQECEEKEESLEEEEMLKKRFVEDNRVEETVRHNNVNEEHSIEQEKVIAGTRKSINQRGNTMNENKAHMYVNFIRVVWNGNRHCFALQEHSILHDTMPVSIAEHGHAMCERYGANKINRSCIKATQHKNDEEYEEFLRSRVWLAYARMKWAELISCTGQVKAIYNVNEIHSESELSSKVNNEENNHWQNNNSIITQWIPLGVCMLKSKHPEEMKRITTKSSDNFDTKTNNTSTNEVHLELEEHESRKEEEQLEEDILYDCVVVVTSELDILLLGKQVDASFLHEIWNHVQEETNGTPTNTNKNKNKHVRKEPKQLEELKVQEELSSLQIRNMKEEDNCKCQEEKQNKKEWEQMLPNSIDAEAEEEKAKLEAWLAEDDDSNDNDNDDDSHNYDQGETSHSYDHDKVNTKREEYQEEKSSFRENTQERFYQINVNANTAAAKDMPSIDVNNKYSSQMKGEEKNVVIGLDNKQQEEEAHSASIIVNTTPQKVDNDIQEDNVNAKESIISDQSSDNDDVDRCHCENEEKSENAEVTNHVVESNTNTTEINICTIQDAQHNAKCNIKVSEEQLECYDVLATLYTSNQSLSAQSLKSHSATQTNMQNQNRFKRKWDSSNTMEVMLEHWKSDGHPSLLLYHHATMSVQRITLPFVQFVVHSSESRSPDNVLYTTAEQNKEYEHNASGFLSTHPSELSESVKELMWKSTQQLMSSWMSFSNPRNDKNNNKEVVKHVIASPNSMLSSWSMPFHLPRAQQPTSSQFTKEVEQQEEKKEESNKSRIKEEEQNTNQVEANSHALLVTSTSKSAESSLPVASHSSTVQDERKSDSSNTKFDLNIGRPLANLMFGWVDKSHMYTENQINKEKENDHHNTHFTNNESSTCNSNCILNVESTSNTSSTLQHPEKEESEFTMSKETKLQNTKQHHTLSSSSSSFSNKHAHSPSPQSPTITQTAISSCLSSQSSLSISKKSNALPLIVESPHMQTPSLAMANSSSSLPSTCASASFWSSSASPHSQHSHRQKKKKRQVKVVSINLHEQNNNNKDDMEHSLQSYNNNNNNIISNNSNNKEDKEESKLHSKEEKQHEEEMIETQEVCTIKNKNEMLLSSPLSFSTKRSRLSTRSDVESDEQSMHMKSAHSTSLYAEVASARPSSLFSLSTSEVNRCSVVNTHNACKSEDEHLNEETGAVVSNCNINDNREDNVGISNNMSPEQITNISHSSNNNDKVMSSYLLLTQLCNVHEPIARHRLYSIESQEYHTLRLTHSVEEENVHEYEVQEHARQMIEHQRKEQLYKRLVLQDMFARNGPISANSLSTKPHITSLLSSANKLACASLSLSDRCIASSQFASQFASWRTERMTNHNKANLFDFHSYFNSLIIPTQIHELHERDKCMYEVEDLRQMQEAEFNALPSPFDVVVIYQNEEKASSSSSLLSWSVFGGGSRRDENETEKKTTMENDLHNETWEPHRTFPFDDEAGQVIDLHWLNSTAILCDKFANYNNLRNYNNSSSSDSNNNNIGSVGNNEEWRWATEQELKKIEDDESLIKSKPNYNKHKGKMKIKTKMMMQSLNKELLHWTVSPWEYAPHWPRTNTDNNNNIESNNNGTTSEQKIFEHGSERDETSKEAILPNYVTNKSKNDNNNNTTEDKCFQWSLQVLPNSRVRRRRLERVRVNVRLLEQREKLMAQHQQQLQALQMELGL